MHAPLGRVAQDSGQVRRAAAEGGVRAAAGAARECGGDGGAADGGGQARRGAAEAQVLRRGERQPGGDCGAAGVAALGGGVSRAVGRGVAASLSRAEWPVSSEMFICRVFVFEEHFRMLFFWCVCICVLRIF